MPFEQYIEKYILEPLDMNHSTFLQPLPANLQSDMAIGYSYDGKRYMAHDFEWKQSAPAGAMSATAADMAKFMIAMLNKGSYKDKRILQESTVEEMQKESFTNDSRVNGIAHGFMEADFNGQRCLFHNGDIFQFHTSHVLLPQQNVGIYVAFNGAQGMWAVNDMIVAFMDYYYPTNKDMLSPPGNLSQDVSKYEGTYMPLRHEYTTMGKLVGLTQSITVKQTGSNRIKVSLGFPAQLSAYYVQTDTDRFRSEDFPPLIYGDIVFGTDSKGNALYQFQENNPTTAYIKLPWYGEPWFTVSILVSSMILFIIILISMPVRIWRNLRIKRKSIPMERRAVFTSCLLGILSLAFTIGFGLIFSRQDTVFGLPSWSMMIFILPYFIALLAVSMVTFTILAWKRMYWNILGRIGYTASTVISLSFVWWIYFWNLWVFKV